MPEELPVTGVVPTSVMIGEDEEETARLREMEGRRATRFPYCPYTPVGGAREPALSDEGCRKGCISRCFKGHDW